MDGSSPTSSATKASAAPEAVTNDRCSMPMRTAGPFGGDAALAGIEVSNRSFSSGEFELRAMTKSQRMRLSRNDLLDHPVGKVLLLRIAAHILERQHCDRRLVGEGQRRLLWSRRARGSSSIADPIDPHRPGNVFDLLLAEIVESVI